MHPNTLLITEVQGYTGGNHSGGKMSHWSDSILTTHCIPRLFALGTNGSWLVRERQDQQLQPGVYANCQEAASCLRNQLFGISTKYLS